MTQRQNYPSASLYPAARWNCEECGGENFERLQILEFDEEEFREEMGIPHFIELDTEEFTSWASPEDVTCTHCLAIHKAIPCGVEDEGPDFDLL